MQQGAIWIIYTLMFGYPVPTHDEHEFTNRTACEILQAFIQRTGRRRVQARVFDKIGDSARLSEFFRASKALLI